MTTKNYYVPFVIEQTGNGERSYDIYSRLLKDRIIMLGTPIDDEVANLIIDLLYVLVDPRVKATFTKGKKAKQIDLDVYDDEENDSGADAAAFYIENEDEILERSKAV